VQVGLRINRSVPPGRLVVLPAGVPTAVNAVPEESKATPHDPSQLPLGAEEQPMNEPGRSVEMPRGSQLRAISHWKPAPEKIPTHGVTLWRQRLLPPWSEGAPTEPVGLLGGTGLNKPRWSPRRLALGSATINVVLDQQHGIVKTNDSPGSRRPDRCRPGRAAPHPWSGRRRELSPT